MAEETIRIMCPNLTCRRVLAVPTSARGRTVRCRGCGINIRVPSKTETVKAPPPPEPAAEEAPAGPGAGKAPPKLKKSA